MPLFSQACLEKLRQTISIADVAAPYVHLKPSGKYLKGLSPFSHEKTPSFFIDPQRNTFKCFSTGYAGDIFRFLELKEQLTFTESVEWLCEKFNIQPEYVGNLHAPATPVSPRKILFEIYAQAAQFFKQQFWGATPIASKVRTYWQQDRYFQLETAKIFDIGFAPADVSLLYNFLKQKFLYNHLLQSGLFYKRKAQPSTCDTYLISRYQGRLIIPIQDIQGRTIAFSGRTLPFLNLPHDPTHESKYINSPETPIFVKGRELFNLAKAREALNKEHGFYLVEGPLDTIRCWECGLKSTVAPQGTGLTEEQLQLLKRYDVPVIGLFDGDTAGIKAGIRLMTIGIPLEIQLRYYLLNTDEDPDGAFLKNPQRCTNVPKNTLSPIDFFVKIYKNADSDTDTVQRRVLQKVFPIIRNCSSSVLRFDLLRKLSQVFNIPQKILEEELQHSRKNSPSVPVITAPSSVLHLPNEETCLLTPEGQILLFLLHAPRWTKKILQYLSLDWIDTQQVAGQLLMKILNEFHENGIKSLDNRDQWNLSEQEKTVWCQLLIEKLPNNDEKSTLTLILQQLYRRFLKKRISDIDKEISKNFPLNEGVLETLQRDRFNYKRALVQVSSSIRLNEE